MLKAEYQAALSSKMAWDTKPQLPVFAVKHSESQPAAYKLAPGYVTGLRTK